MRSLFLLALLLPLVFSPVALAQISMPGSGFPGERRANADPALRRMEKRMAAERNVDRQEKIVADTNHLLKLAKDLDAAVAHSTKDTLSLKVVKKAEEIEKLAKSIKERMRDGN